MKKTKKLLALCIILASVVGLLGPACVAKITPLYSFETLPPYRYNNFRVGDIVRFGAYEQDNRTWDGKETISWTILDIREEKALILSRYILDVIPYHRKNESITWEDCSLREWLNNSFLRTAFSSDEIDQIVPVTINNNNNDEYHIYGGRRTTDRVFVLSYDDATTFFWADADRKTTATEYAQSRGVYIDKDTGNSWWWLRSPGKTENRAGNVVSRGVPSTYGAFVNSGEGGVRPALWVNLDALY